MGLLPAGIHDCTLDEIAERLTWNPDRTRIWDGCREFLKELQDMGMTYPIFVDGGYVTDRHDPSDVDVCLDLRNGAPEGHLKDALFLFMLRRKQIRADRFVDFCPSFPGQNDFSAYFQYLGTRTASAKRLHPKHRKGILRVATWANG